MLLLSLLLLLLLLFLLLCHVRTVQAMAGLVFYFMIDRDRPEIFETGKAWSVFNLLNRNWTVSSLELRLPYESAIRLYGFIH